jgi:hypothetical protein
MALTRRVCNVYMLGHVRFPRGEGLERHILVVEFPANSSAERRGIMKKFLVIGALALVVAVLLEYQAWAWKNASFSVGLNWSYSSGGNSLLWGAYRNGQPGGCDLPNCPQHYYAIQHGYNPVCPTFDGPFNGPAPAFPPAPAAAPQASWYNQPAFQPVNYAPTSYYWYGR